MQWQYIKYFAAQPVGAVSFTTLQQLDASITKLDDTLHVRVEIDTIISVFKLLNETASLHTDSGVSLLARNLFIKLQNSVTVKERSRTSLPQKNDFSSEAEVRENILLSAFKTML